MTAIVPFTKSTICGYREPRPLPPDTTLGGGAIPNSVALAAYYSTNVNTAILDPSLFNEIAIVRENGPPLAVPQKRFSTWVGEGIFQGQSLPGFFGMVYTWNHCWAPLTPGPGSQPNLNYPVFGVGRCISSYGGIRWSNTSLPQGGGVSPGCRPDPAGGIRVRPIFQIDPLINVPGTIHLIAFDNYFGVQQFSWNIRGSYSPSLYGGFAPSFIPAASLPTSYWPSQDAMFIRGGDPLRNFTVFGADGPYLMTIMLWFIPNNIPPGAQGAFTTTIQASISESACIT